MTDPKVQQLLNDWRSRLEGDSGRGSPEATAPTIEALRARAGRLEPVGLEELFANLPEFDEAALRRSNEGELEVRLTDDELQVWDASARCVVVLDCPDGSPPSILGHTLEERPPVRLTLPVDRGRSRALVVISAKDALDPDLCLFWANDALIDGRELQPRSSGSIRVAVARVQPRLRPLTMNVLGQALPPTHPEVQKRLLAAAQQGRTGRFAEAATLYARARQLALTRNDATGQLKSALGLAMALRWAGYGDDADRLLQAVASTSVVDPVLGAQFGRQLAWAGLRCGRLDEAQAWLDEAVRLNGPDPWSWILEARLATDRGRWSLAIEHLDQITAEELQSMPPTSRKLVRMYRARCLAELGRPDTLQQLGPRPEDDWQLALLHLLVRARLQQSALGSIRWSQVTAELADLPIEATRDPDVRGPLVELARWALQAHQVGPANRLLELALGADEHAALVVSSHAGTMVRGFDGHLRASKLTWSDLRELAREARTEVHSGTEGRASRTLQTLLEVQHAPPGRVSLLDDGCLRGAPIQALIELALDRPVPMRHVELGSRRGSTAPPQNPRVLSLADVQGDLPHARSELPPELLAERHHGLAATFERLRGPQELGLLHLAVHTRLVDGVNWLELADRLVGPAELLQLDLVGEPLCILSGCSTMGMERDQRSFASALLQAGAGAVVSTAWPVADQEMARLVLELTKGWRERPVVELVAELRYRFRKRGAPARLWAAPQVY